MYSIGWASIPEKVYIFKPCQVKEEENPPPRTGDFLLPKLASDYY